MRSLRHSSMTGYIALAVSGRDMSASVITLMGFYTGVAMTLAFYDVPADAPGMAR